MKFQSKTVANELVSVVPISSPSNNIFYMDFVYKDKTDYRKDKLLIITRIIKWEFIKNKLKEKGHL